MPPVFWRIHKLETTVSTNDDARRAAEAGEGEGLVIVAERQTAGRGRQGRVWESPNGNLYASILLQPKDRPQDAALYSFIVALAVVETVKEYLAHSSVALKWPNDVLVNGKKIAGILLEVVGDTLIVGIGLNIAHYPENALYPATSLAQEQAQVELQTVLQRLLERLGSWHDVMKADGFAPVRETWMRMAQKGRLTVRLPSETISGDFMEIDGQGCLRLRLDGGEERVIHTGDVVLPPKD
jgi:BirA family biotin operon repressor/biotin-[acetyl-CoA-carboxylase] ligase